MHLDRATIGGSISTFAMLVASSGRIFFGGFLLALGVGILIPGRKKDEQCH